MSIQKGDLVMVTKAGSCGCPAQLGDVFTVTGFHTGPVGTTWQCRACLAKGILGTERTYALGGSAIHTSLRRLIKIDPPKLSTDTEEEREIHS